MALANLLIALYGIAVLVFLAILVWLLRRRPPPTTLNKVNEEAESGSGVYGVSVMPSTFIVDRDGKVRYIHLVYLPGYEFINEKQIRELLK